MYKNNAIKISEILSGLIGSTTLQAVYNYDVKQVDSYPFAKVSVLDGDGDFYDTAENQMTSQYRVSVINQNTNIVNAEPIMRELVDDILTELAKKENITLGGTVVYAKTTSIRWGWSETDESIRICDIIVEVLENIGV